MNKQVLILMGSDSDLDVMAGALKCLKEFEVDYEVRVCSVHRSPEKALGLAASARDEGFRVIIGGAGGAAHLAGALAAKTTLPVIGIPIENGALHGVDALYSTVQMPPGVPVATVAINGSQNAAILAVQMLALSDDRLAEALMAYKDHLVEQVEAKDSRAQERLESEGLS